MPIQQISVFLENRIGRIQSIAKILGDAQINVRAISVADTAEFGILRLIVENVAKAEKVLRDAGVAIHLNEVTAVEVNHRPGGLFKVFNQLELKGINVEYMYTLAQPEGRNPTLIFRFSDPTSARKLLREGGCRLLDDKDLSL